jgi:hypothetical protein
VAIAPPLYFSSKNSSFGYLVEEKQIKNRKKNYLDVVQTEKNEPNQSSLLS